jgi:hypothetical protein
MTRPRHHVVGQCPASRARKRGGVDRATGLRRDIGHEPRAARALARNDDRLAHFGLRQQLRLDLAQLDAEAADLHLVVDAAQVVQLAFAVPTNQVAGAVEAAAAFAVERIGHEALGAQRRAST